MMPDDPRHAAALARALEFTSKRVKEIVEEAREQRCFFYRSALDRPCGTISLQFTDGAGFSFRRTLNCNSFFKVDGLYSDFQASLIHADADALVFASGEFQEYRTAVQRPSGRATT